MKTAGKGKPKWQECGDDARRKHPGSVTGGWEQQKVRPSRQCFCLTSQSIERPLAQLNRQLLAWERIYNTVRPHQALGYLTPLEFLAQSSSQRKDLLCH